MTDWTTTNVQIQGECTAAGCMRAGNDMVMPGLPEDHENIKKELKRCIYNTVNIVLQSNITRAQSATLISSMIGYLSCREIKEVKNILWGYTKSRV